MKNIYVVWNFQKDNKLFAAAEKISANYNLLAYATSYAAGNDLTGAAITLNVFSTWKEAKETADFWNECYKKNNTYMY